MRRATTDRGDILHFAGFHRLSPALDDASRPAFSAGPGDGLARCGWEPFFGAMRAAGVALQYDPEDPGSARFVPDSELRQERGHHPALSQALAHARRFWKALVS